MICVGSMFWDVCFCRWMVRSEVAWPETGAQTWGERGLSGERVYQHRHQWKSEWGPLSRRNSSGVGGWDRERVRERKRERDRERIVRNRLTVLLVLSLTASFTENQGASEREGEKEKRTLSLPASLPFSDFSSVRLTPFHSFCFLLSISQSFPPHLFLLLWLMLYTVSSRSWISPPLKGIFQHLRPPSVTTKNKVNLSFSLQKYEQKLRWL